MQAKVSKPKKNRHEPAMQIEDSSLLLDVLKTASSFFQAPACIFNHENFSAHFSIPAFFSL
jgi:hypothetical protein